MTENLTYQQENVLELMKEHISILNDNIKTLDRKAEINIGVSSIILGFASALNLGQSQTPEAKVYLIPSHPTPTNHKDES